MNQVEADLTLFGLGRKATRAEIKQRYHELALIEHPDHGGDLTRFQSFNEAYKRLQKRRCPECKGKGETLRQRGLRAAKTRCAACGGRGI